MLVALERLVGCHLRGDVVRPSWKGCVSVVVEEHEKGEELINNVQGDCLQRKKKRERSD